MVFNPCCRLPLRTAVLIVASIAVSISVGKLILIGLGLGFNYHTHFQQMSGKHFHNVSTHIMGDIEVFIANGVVTVEVLLNVINIIFGVLLLIHGVRKDCMWPINSFLLYSIMFFFFSLGTTNVKTLLGIISNQVFAFEALALGIDLYVILVANQACMEAWDAIRQSGVQMETNNNVRAATPTDASPTHSYYLDTP